MTVITRSKGGTAERQVDVKAHDVPDLWHHYISLKEGGYVVTADEVLDCWHLCHDLIRHIEAMEEETIGGWSVDDVRERAQENAEEEEADGEVPSPIPTREEAKAILGQVLRNADADLGITWENIELHTEIYMREHHPIEYHQASK